jgi:predicted PurR-regulated permease PerM
LSRTNIAILILFALGLFAAYSIYKPFILPMVVAMLLSMATSNLTRSVTSKFKSKKIATVIMTLIMIILILAPIAYIATKGIKYAADLDLNSVNTILAKIKLLVKDIPYIGDAARKYLTPEQVLPFIQNLSIYIGKLGTKGLTFIKDSFLVVVFYSFIVYNQEKITQFLYNILSTSRRESMRMLDEISSTMEIVFFSIIVTAILEGVLFGVFISFYGFNGLFLGFLYGFSSLIPVIGGLIVWLPVSLLAWSKIDPSAAITIALYSIIVISFFADTIIKPIIIKVIKEKFLKSTINIDELLIFFSIIAGMGSYGFWGMILGPAITTFVITTTKTYLEYNKRSA